MTELFRNLSLIEKAADELVQSKKCFYSVQQIWKDIKEFSNLKIETMQTDQNQNTNNFILIKNTPYNRAMAKTCIIYLHGLSSYCAEGKFLIPYLGQCFNLCLFDSRGHGRSPMSNITYGLYQSEDLYKIICRLKKEGIKEFILWGRSMGAVTALMLLGDEKKLAILHNDIKYVIADSPFSSFRQVTIDIVTKKLFLPEFIAKIIADSLLQKIQQKYGYSLQNINVNFLENIQIPAIFIYSDSDQVINPSHTHSIFQSYPASKEKLKIHCDHNQKRPEFVILTILRKLRASITCHILRESKINSKKGINLTSQSRPNYSSTIHKNKQQKQKYVENNFLKISNNDYLRNVNKNYNKSSNLPVTSRAYVNDENIPFISEKRTLAPQNNENKKLTNRFYL